MNITATTTVAAQTTDRTTTGWSFDASRVRDASWLHWTASVPLLAAHISGVAGAIEAAIGICVIAAGGFYVTHDRVRAMPVQVRLNYLALLGVGLLPGMWWIHWSQLCGTSAMVLVGYCPLVRMLTLLPWNRREPLTRSLAWRVIVAPPTGGLLVPPARGTREQSGSEPPVPQGC